MAPLTDVFDRIDEMVRQQMEQDSIPGLSLAVVDRDELIYQQTYGVSSLASGTPVEGHHRFEFGSIGKSFTCILLLQLCEEGLILLDEPVTTYLPWFEMESSFEPITPHHLMTHTAGIINGTDFPADSRYEVWALRETKAANPPGEHFHYSNVGYKTLGLVLEAVTGTAYPELVRERILEPLGMTATSPSITHDLRRLLAAGHAPFYDDRPWQQGEQPVPATWLETDTADGCIAGTTVDLARYLQMLMNGGAGPQGRLLSSSGFDLMTAPHAPLSSSDLGLSGIEQSGYGYGLYSFVSDGQRIVGHSGGMVGYYAHMAANLSTGIGAVTTINGIGHQQPIVDYAIDLVRAARAGADLPDVPAPRDPFAVPDASACAGTYTGSDGAIEIIAGNGRLYVAAAPSRIALERRGDDAFIPHDGRFDPYPLRFQRDEDGQIISVCHGERSWHRSRPEEGPAPGPTVWHSYPGHYRSHNPWQSNFRIVLRDGLLYLIHPSGREDPLTDRGDGVFRVGDARSPEFISFDTIVGDEAWRARYSGCDYYRFFTP